jgi:hypothetical protein
MVRIFPHCECQEVWKHVITTPLHCVCPLFDYTQQRIMNIVSEKTLHYAIPSVTLLTQTILGHVLYEFVFEYLQFIYFLQSSYINKICHDLSFSFSFSFEVCHLHIASIFSKQFENYFYVLLYEEHVLNNCTYSRKTSILSRTSGGCCRRTNRTRWSSRKRYMKTRAMSW